MSDDASREVRERVERTDAELRETRAELAAARADQVAAEHRSAVLEQDLAELRAREAVLRGELHQLVEGQASRLERDRSLLAAPQSSAARAVDWGLARVVLYGALMVALFFLLWRLRS